MQIQSENPVSVYNVTEITGLPQTFSSCSIWLFSSIFQHSNLKIQVNITEANRVFIFIPIWLVLCKSGELMVC